MRRLLIAAALLGAACSEESAKDPPPSMAPQPGVLAAPLPGAVFTTTQDGTVVDGNIYSAKCGSLGVWLNGGPGHGAPDTAAGLPDGDYVFMVTDPSGMTLLSTDPIYRRQFEVSGGVIVGLAGLGNHNTSTNLVDGGTTIELCPFDDTPNPGGEYKVWVMPAAEWNDDDACHGEADLVFGFCHAHSKTDNFKVLEEVPAPPDAGPPPDAPPCEDEACDREE